jgi:hypothetical protein
MPSTTCTWGGSHGFRLNGCAVHEDTLRIKSNYRKSEAMLRLVLPTLCITYADSKFQNAIGGEQKNYPDSDVYGPAYFAPPVSISGEKEIERLTYIRGAHRVEIGPRETVIEFPSWKELVIPRLRLSREKPVEGTLHVPNTVIAVTDPLKVDIRQFADGRHVGGVCLEKRHPEWRPPKVDQTYEAWVHVLDGITSRPLPKVEVDVWHWDPKQEGFRPGKRAFTDQFGNIRLPERPSGELEAFVVRLPGHRAVVRCLRPLAGQKVRLHMRVWPLTRTLIPYVWRKGDTLDRMVQFCGHAANTILEVNRLRKTDLKPKLRVILPCYAATYRLESWDDLDWVGKAFGYRDAQGLARVNGVEFLTGAEEIKLPDWYYLYAGENVTLDDIDDLFGLPKGSSVTVGRVFHPEPRLPFVGETVAVPTARFVK